MGGHYIIKLNNRCNMNCLFCADPDFIRHKDDPDFIDIMKGIRDNRAEFSSLIISGGEPTIHKRLFTLMKYAKQEMKYERISLVTNAVLLDYKEMVEKLVKCGVDSFQISYFAPDEKIHNALSRSKDTFEKVQRGIINAVESGVEVRINLVITKFNFKQLPKMVDDLINMGVDGINLAFMNPIGTSVIDGKSILAMTFSETMPYVKESIELGKQRQFTNISIENFPLCVASDYIGYIADLKKPDENEEYYNEGKTKPERCTQCLDNGICDGVWRAYIKQFGDEELKPRRS